MKPTAKGPAPCVARIYRLSEQPVEGTIERLHRVAGVASANLRDSLEVLVSASGEVSWDIMEPAIQSVFAMRQPASNPFRGIDWSSAETRPRILQQWEREEFGVEVVRCAVKLYSQSGCLESSDISEALHGGGSPSAIFYINKALRAAGWRQAVRRRKGFLTRCWVPPVEEAI